MKRMTQSKARFRQLHEVWRSKILNKKLKIQLYRSAVISILVYGHEAWDLTPTMMITLNGWNSRCVALITGREIRQEAGRMGQTFDLVADLRVRRLKWVGHVLRMDDSGYVKQSIKAVWTLKKNGKLRREGSVLISMDVPKCSSIRELQELAGVYQDLPEWPQLVRNLRTITHAYPWSTMSCSV